MSDDPLSVAYRHLANYQKIIEVKNAEIERLKLTDKEIEAISAAIDRFRDWVNGFDDDERATILRNLLERIKENERQQ